MWWYKQKLAHKVRANFSRKILAVSKEVKERLIKLWAYPEDKVQSIYHGVDLSRFSPDEGAFINMRKKLGIGYSDVVIISTARLSKEKCLDRLIVGFDALSKKYKNLWLLIIGSGPLENSLKELAEKSQSKERILFLGQAEDVSNYLKMSDIYVLPSDNEGLSIALLEAQATGLICIATKTPGANEIIKDHFNGFLVERTSEDILRGLELVLNLTTEQKEKISKNAREHISENFEIKKATEHALNFLGFEYV